MPVYCEQETEDAIRRVFPYAFHGWRGRLAAAGIPKLQFERIRPGVPFQVLGQTVLPIRLEHGRFPVLGFRVGDLAYCTDVSRIPDESWPLLEGLDVLMLDALRHRPAPDAFQPRARRWTWSSGSGPGGPSSRIYLTRFDHGPTQDRLPDGRRSGLRWAGLAILNATVGSRDADA